jgi:outer membrane protein TolC
MNRVMCRISLAVGLSLPALAGAASADALTPRTLEDCLGLARAANRTLQAATSRADAARERVGAAAPLPDPRLMYGYYVSPEMMKGRQELTLTQELPFFGKRGLRRELARRDASAEAHAVRATALDVDFEVKSEFYRFVGLNETARVLDTEAGLLRRMRDVAQVRYSAGTSEQQDVLKIELSLSRLADEVTLNRRDLAGTRARLNELMGRAATDSLPDPVWTMPDVRVIDQAAHADSALARRPEVAIAREEVARADASKRLATREYWPDFMLGVQYEFGGTQDPMIPWASEDWWQLQAGVGLPLWIGSRRAMSREADAMRRSAAYELEGARLRAAREVEEALARARAARERHDRFMHTILPQAEAAFASSEAGYRSGRVDFIDYLDSERMLLEMRKEFAMVTADLGIQMAALERAAALR